MEGIWLSDLGLAKAFTTGLTLLIVCRTEGDLSPSLELGLWMPMAMCFTGIGMASASTLIFNGTEFDVGSAFSARIGGEDGLARIGGEDGLEAKIDLMGAWMSLFCCGHVDIGDIGDI